MRKIHGLSDVMLVLVIVWSCGSQLKVSSDYDKNADFTKYKAFVVNDSKSLNEHVTRLNQDRIINAIKSEMTKKGFKEDTTSPEIMINTTAVVKDMTSVSSSNYYSYGSVYRPYTWGPGVSYKDYDVNTYKDGSLIIDIVEVESKKLVWQGIGNKEIDAPTKHPERDIPKIIGSIMAGFPPGISQNK